MQGDEKIKGPVNGMRVVTWLECVGFVGAVCVGFVGVVGIIVLFMLLIWRGIHIAQRTPDAFGGLIAIGITTLIGLQTVVNIGVVTGMLPAKGITLPFISYGGSSLLVSLFSIGILLNISRDMNKTSTLDTPLGIES